jgi:hypothetical protein
MSSGCGCFSKKYELWEQWNSHLAVSRTLTKHSDIQSENTRFKTLWLSPLTGIPIDVADSCVLPLRFSGLWAFCHSVLLLTYTYATNIGSYPELDAWKLIHILGFITPDILSICLMIMSDLSIFLAWIWVGVGIDKFLNDLGLRNILDTKLHGLGSCLCLFGFPLTLHYCSGLNAVIEWKVHIEKLELNDT